MATKSKPRKRTRTVQAQTITAGTAIRFEQPKSARQPKATASEVAVVVAQEINPVSGFVGFLREHAIVGLAVGFAIATQVQALVKQLITSFIDPLYGLLFSGQKLSALNFTLSWHGRSQQFSYGAFAYALLDFVFVLLVVYVIIKFFNLDQLDKPKKKE